MTLNKAYRELTMTGSLGCNVRFMPPEPAVFFRLRGRTFV
ncbi:hypothetical protein SRDD_12970 [Serratia sp. DD3]|nr:hypothetical protein SRDD_12970 [Serratia sp. DD3]